MPYFPYARSNAFAKFNQGDKEFCISKINNISTKDEHDIHRQQQFEEFQKTRRRSQNDNGTQKQTVFQFHVLKRTDKVKVYKKAFINLHGECVLRITKDITL